MAPCFRAACTASITSLGVVSLSAAKMPPVCSQRTPSWPKIWSQSKSPGLSWLAARVAAVRNAHRAAHAEAALGEIEAVAHRPADAVVGHPLDELGRHAALQDEILEQPADVVVRKRGADGGAQAEAAAQTAGDVVFAAAFPDLEFARCAHAPFAGVKPQHDFAQRNEIVSAGALGLSVQHSHSCQIEIGVGGWSSRFT